MRARSACCSGVTAADAEVEELRVAADGVERSAELMAHDGQEVRLRAVGRDRLVARGHRLGCGRLGHPPRLDGLRMEPGIVHGDRGAARQVLGQHEVDVAEAMARLGRDEGDRPQHVSARHHGDDDVGADSERTEEPEVLRVDRHRLHRVVRDLGDELGAAGPDHARRAERVVRLRRIALVELARDDLRGRIRVKHGNAPDATALGAHVHDAPRPQVRERQGGDGGERRLMVERRGEAAARLGEERESVAARLGDVARALGGAGGVLIG